MTHKTVNLSHAKTSSFGEGTSAAIDQHIAGPAQAFDALTASGATQPITDAIAASLV